jgi:hypothetical protein
VGEDLRRGEPRGAGQWPTGGYPGPQGGGTQGGGPVPADKRHELEGG